LLQWQKHATGMILLASVAVPQINSYRVKAYNAAALSDLKNVQTVLKAYYEDNNFYPHESYALMCNPIVVFCFSRLSR
jgi:hypothetical protein